LKCYCKKCINEDNRKREVHYNETRRQYRETHKEEVRANKRKYYQENKETIIAQNMKWARTLKGKFSTYRIHAKRRNIEFSFPYMHDGRYKTLSEVINHYTGRDLSTSNTSLELSDQIILSSEQKVDLLAFLLTLTDKEFLFNSDFSFPREILLSN
jgi:cytochrome c peroxidase